MAESRPPLLPLESISHPGALLSMLLSEGKRLLRLWVQTDVRSEWLRISALQSLLFVAIMWRHKRKRKLSVASSLLFSRGCFLCSSYFVLGAALHPRPPQKKGHTQPRKCVRTRGLEREGRVPCEVSSGGTKANIYFEGWGLGGLGFPSLCSASVGSSPCEEPGR